jgi:hypothetical protein
MTVAADGTAGRGQDAAVPDFLALPDSSSPD